MQKGSVHFTSRKSFVQSNIFFGGNDVMSSSISSGSLHKNSYKQSLKSSVVIILACFLRVFYPDLCFVLYHDHASILRVFYPDLYFVICHDYASILRVFYRSLNRAYDLVFVPSYVPLLGIQNFFFPPDDHRYSKTTMEIAAIQYTTAVLYRSFMVIAR